MIIVLLYSLGMVWFTFVRHLRIFVTDCVCLVLNLVLGCWMVDLVFCYLGLGDDLFVLLLVCVIGGLFLV